MKKSSRWLHGRLGDAHPYYRPSPALRRLCHVAPVHDPIPASPLLRASRDCRRHGAGCGRADAARLGEAGDAAAKVYVAPGQYDEFYAFMSGGFNGQVTVYGLPSGRLLKQIPVFSQNAENG